MNKKSLLASHTPINLVLATILVLSGCSDSGSHGSANQMSSTPAATSTATSTTTTDSTAAAESACAGEVGIDYVCGLINAEDILRIGTTDWLFVAGMNGELAGDNSINGKLHLVNRQNHAWEVLFPGPAPVFAQDMSMFAACPGPVDTSNFSVHGLALQNYPGGSDQYRLYVVSHGAREAVEIFTVDASAKPEVKWVGCVPMPVTSWTNSLVILTDGGFRATQFMDPTGSGMAGVNAGEITGQVFEWHPGGQVTIIAGTELSGPNGIAMSEDERFIYVAAFGTREIVRFDLSTTPVTKTAAAVGVAPDNVRWSSNGTLYTAGGNYLQGCGGPDCGAGWSVWEVDPDTMQANRVVGMATGSAMAGVSSALLVEDEVWVGTYLGDRIGIMPLPEL